MSDLPYHDMKPIRHFMVWHSLMRSLKMTRTSGCQLPYHDMKPLRHFMIILISLKVKRAFGFWHSHSQKLPFLRGPGSGEELTAGTVPGGLCFIKNLLDSCWMLRGHACRGDRTRSALKDALPPGRAENGVFTDFLFYPP